MKRIHPAGAVWGRITVVAGVLAVMLFCLQLFAHNKADVDLWGNAGFVKALPWQAGFARVNTFAFTDSGHEWVNHEWLAQYLFNIIFSVYGSGGLLLLKVAAGFLLAAVLWRSITGGGLHGVAALLYFVLTFSTIGYGFSMRPHLFTYLFLAVMMVLMGGLREGKGRYLAFMIPIGVIWANLHGAFFAGIMLAGIFTISELAVFAHGRDRRNLTAAMLTGCAGLILVAGSLVNPYGLKLWGFIIESAGMPRPLLSEWAPFNPVTDFADHVDFLFLAIFSVGVLFAGWRGRDWPLTMVFAVALAAALVLRRNIPVFAIIAAFIVPGMTGDGLNRAINGLVARVPRLAALILCLLLAVFSAGAIARRDYPCRIVVSRDEFPVETVEFMRHSGLEGNLLVFFNWAEQCIWHLHPGIRVFMDGRFNDAYDEQTIREYFTVIYAWDGWEDILESRQVQILLLHRGLPVYDRISGMTGQWQLAAFCPFSGLFLRRDIFPGFTGKDPVDFTELPEHSGLFP